MYEIVVTEKKGWLVDKEEFTEEALQAYKQRVEASKMGGITILPKKNAIVPLEVEMFRQMVDELDLAAVIRAVNGL